MKALSMSSGVSRDWNQLCVEWGRGCERGKGDMHVEYL